jgi:hypothetical protein
MAGIVERAIEAVGRDLAWDDDDARQARLAAVNPEELETFDRAFIGYPDNLTELLYRYVSSNRSEIGVSAEF